MIALDKLRLAKQLRHAIHIQVRTKRRKTEITRQFYQAIDGAANRPI